MSGGEVKSMRLKVGEAKSGDVGRGIARIDKASRDKLNVSPGDLVEISAKRTTVAVVWPLHPSDEGRDILRIDGFVRRNAGVSIGDTAKLEKKAAAKAKQVVVAPTQPIRFGQDFHQYVKQQLLGRPIGRGDVVIIPVLGEALQMFVVSVNPGPYALVDQNSNVTVRARPMKEAELRIPG